MGKGLIITRVYQIVEFQPKRCFQEFSDKVSNDRRAGDLNPASQLVAETSKLIGNSVYGRSLLNKDKHRDYKLCSLDDALRYINEPLYQDSSEINDDLFEIQMSKRRIIYDQPIQLGFFVS